MNMCTQYISRFNYQMLVSGNSGFPYMWVNEGNVFSLILFSSSLSTAISSAYCFIVSINFLFAAIVINFCLAFYELSSFYLEFSFIICSLCSTFSFSCYSLACNSSFSLSFSLMSFSIFSFFSYRDISHLLVLSISFLIWSSSLSFSALSISDGFIYLFPLYAVALVTLS